MTQKEERAAYVQYVGLVRYTIKRYKEILSREDYEELESDCLLEIFRAIDAHNPDHESGATLESLISRYVITRAGAFVRSSGSKKAIFNSGTVSLSTRLESGEGTIEDYIADAEVEHTDILQLSAAIASIQDPRRRDIVTRISEGETMRSIGREYGVVRQRVFQIKEDGIDEMSGNVGRRRS